MLAAWLGAAWAAVPFALPPGEPAELWAPALELADFRIGAATSGPRVLVEAREGRWAVRVVDVAGVVHVDEVAPPLTPRAREDLVWVARSLVDPLVPPFPGAGSAQPPPVPRPARAALPAATSPPPSRMAPVSAAVAPLEPPPTRLARVTGTPAPPPPPLVAPPVAPARPRAEVVAGATAWARGGLAPAPAVGVGVGVAHGPVGGEVRVEGSPVAALRGAGEAEAGTGVIAAGVDARWCPATPRVAPVLELGLGAAHRRFVEDGDPVASAWTPVLTAGLGLEVDLGRGLAVAARLQAATETRSARVTVDGVPVDAWSPTAVGLGLELRVGRPPHGR